MNRSFLAASALVVLTHFTAPRAAEAQVLDLPEGGQHVVVVGNTLWDLAAHFYGDPFLWPRIYEANVDRIEDPHWIYPGQLILIPDEEGNLQEVMVVAGEEEPTEEPPAADPVQEIEPVVYREPGRTKFYRDTTEVTRAAEEALQRWLAVPRSIFYSAPFLDFQNGREAMGVIVGFEGQEEIRMPKEGPVMYDRVVLDLKGSLPAPGTRLQAFSLEPAREGLGPLVATPTGLVTVLHRSEDGVVALVEAQYDQLLKGDLVRPLPEYPGVPGLVAEPVRNGPMAGVVAFHELHELHQPGDYLFIDLGRQGGIGVGDEFVIEKRTPEARVEGRAQIVGVQEEVATARIVMIRNPVFVDGADLRLDRRMPGR